MRNGKALDENEVSEGVVKWLRGNGYLARALVAGQQGIDVAAWHPETGHRWAIEAKGATNSKRPDTRSEPSERAAYAGLSAAFLVATSWTGIRAMRDTSIGIAVPDDRHFVAWTAKIEHACRALGIAIFHVGSEGVSMVRPEGVFSDGSPIIARSRHLPEPDGDMPPSLRRNFKFLPYGE